jgi:hypothetical protein
LRRSSRSGRRRQERIATARITTSSLEARLAEVVEERAADATRLAAMLEEEVVVAGLLEARVQRRITASSAALFVR